MVYEVVQSSLADTPLADSNRVGIASKFTPGTVAPIDATV